MRATSEREASGERVAEVVRANAASLLRLARTHSLCDDDAADAYQRTLEIYLQRVDRVDHATAGSWLRTVCKHEAIRLRAARQRQAPEDALAWDEVPSADPSDPEERAASLERVARAAEALQACRPEEARAMLLRADGSSYSEIGELCGWSYSKVNRALAEGRARFLKRFACIESGAACGAYARVLSAIVDGEATPDDYVRLRPHLRHCQRCRSTLKAMYDCEPALGALVPAGALVLAAPDGPGVLSRAFESLAAEVGDRLVRAHALVEAAAASKAAAVVASTAAVAAGGAAVADHAGPARASADARAHARPAEVRAHVRAASLRSVTPTATLTAPVPPVAPAVPPASPASTSSPTPSPSSTPAGEDGEFGIEPHGPSARVATEADPAEADGRAGAKTAQAGAPAETASFETGAPAPAASPGAPPPAPAPPPPAAPADAAPPPSRPSVSASAAGPGGFER